MSQLSQNRKPALLSLTVEEIVCFIRSFFVFLLGYNMVLFEGSSLVEIKQD